MTIRTYTALLLLLFIACKPTPKQKGAAGTVSAADFNEFVNGLSTIKPPNAFINLYEAVEGQYMYRDSSIQFSKFHALRLPSPDNFIAIIYDGTAGPDEKYSSILVTYNQDGSVIQKTVIFELSKSNRAEGVWKKLAIPSDSVLELRTFQLDTHSPEEEKYLSAAVKKLLIQADGHHSWLNSDKEPFAKFIGNFPQLTLPLSFPQTPNSGNWPEFASDNSWFDLKEMLTYDFPRCYKMGKLNISGSKFSTVFIKTADVITHPDNEAHIDDAVHVVVFDANGKETDRIKATGKDWGEDGSYTRWKNFTMDAAGVMHIQEEIHVPVFEASMYADTYSSMLKTDVTVQPNGRLDVVATNFEMDMQKLSIDSTTLGNFPSDTSHHVYEFLGNYPGTNVNVVLHFWTLKGEYVYELITVDGQHKILDAAVIAANLPSGKQPALHVAIPDRALYVPPMKKMKNSGPVKILLKDLVYVVTAEGKLIKQVEGEATRSKGSE
ncbi:hypothetical protein [Chitinophaga sp. Cy-1792]|uniref:hypothetical protein n=1 Tax=Chitinophaga sp. Cy-1792 TaxID=2608339 RepID=UPI00141FB2DE|nr:hypothetical protein [Chitinophaga sp. Cy-1792]NIG56062.1 hypothetical protein [Chitinophaga sp. Cy-1792]